MIGHVHDGVGLRPQQIASRAIRSVVRLEVAGLGHRDHPIELDAQVGLCVLQHVRVPVRENDDLIPPL
jgi:hypothetical protein